MQVEQAADAAEARLASIYMVSSAASLHSRHGVDKIENVQDPVLASCAALQAAFYSVVVCWADLNRSGKRSRYYSNDGTK